LKGQVPLNIAYRELKNYEKSYEYLNILMNINLINSNIKNIFNNLRTQATTPSGAGGPAAPAPTPAPAARPKTPQEERAARQAKLTPEQIKWLGGADFMDPHIYQRMMAAVPSKPAAEKPPIEVAPGLGGMSARYESGSRGSAAIGWDSTGGTSFGKYQIASKTGTMNKFMDFLKTSNPEAHKRLSEAGPADTGKEGAFAQEWKKLAGEGKLGASEHDLLKRLISM